MDGSAQGLRYSVHGLDVCPRKPALKLQPPALPAHRQNLWLELQPPATGMSLTARFRVQGAAF